MNELMEEKEVVTLYKNRIVLKPLLFVIIMFLLLIFLILFVAEPGPGTTRADMMPIVMFFMFFIAVMGFLFVLENKVNKNRLSVKANGKVYSGKVLHVYNYRSSDKERTKLLVEFFDGIDKKIILSENFPYYIKTNDLDLYSIITKKVDMEEYDYSHNQNKIDHVQYEGNGYISFEQTNLTRAKINYNGSRNKNFEGDLTCRVYEQDGKYVVDDIDGYSKKEAKKAKILGAKIFIIIMLIFVIMFINYYMIIKVNNLI